MSQEIFDQFCKDTKPILAKITDRAKANLKSCNADYYILDGADPGFSDPNKYKVLVVEIHEDETGGTLQLQLRIVRNSLSPKHFKMLSETDSHGNKNVEYERYKDCLERYIEEKLEKAEGEKQAVRGYEDRAIAIRDHFNEASVPILAERFNNKDEGIYYILNGHENNDGTQNNDQDLNKYKVSVAGVIAGKPPKFTKRSNKSMISQNLSIVDVENLDNELKPLVEEFMNRAAKDNNTNNSSSSKQDADTDNQGNADEKEASEDHPKVPHPTIKVMQWNQKFLSSHNEHDCEQIKNISDTIKAEDPDVVVMEEVMGKWGEEAVERICTMLNSDRYFGSNLEKDAKEYYSFMVTEPLSSKSSDETFACFYKENVVGKVTAKVLFKYGFKPTEDAFIHQQTIKSEELVTRANLPTFQAMFEDEIDSNYSALQVGNATINFDEAMNVFEEYRANCKNRWWFDSSNHNNEDVGFDYKPVLFSFEGKTKDGGVLPFHVIGVHGSTGEKRYNSKKHQIPEQNIMEMVYLQCLCAQAAQEEEFVILLGDFNTQEAANFGNVGLWDQRMNLPMNGKHTSWMRKETVLLQRARGSFLNYYDRAIDARLPTNVFPFLAGLCVVPKHNDDIWLPTKLEGWTLLSDECNCTAIPSKVLQSWDAKAQQYYMDEEVCIDGDTSHLNIDEENEALKRQEEEDAREKYAVTRDRLSELALEVKELEEQELEEQAETYDKELDSKRIELDAATKEYKKARKSLNDILKMGEKSGADKRKAGKINSLLARIWSDHRPVVASFQCEKL
jgi:hypothetical protein